MHTAWLLVTCHWRTRRHSYVIEAVALGRAFLQCHIPDPMVAAVEVLHHVRGAQRRELELVHEVARVAVADPYDIAASGKGQGSAVTMRRGEQALSHSASHTSVGQIASARARKLAHRRGSGPARTGRTLGRPTAGG